METTQNTKRRKGFTLVELIIVITILAILATIAFISFQGYSSQSRDSNRVATVKNIENGVNIFFTKTGKVPSPDNLMGTGVLNGIALNFVGKVGANIARSINLNEVPLDPRANEQYWYGVDILNRYYQVGLTLESETAYHPSIQSSYAGNILEAKVQGSYQYPLKIGKVAYSLPSLLFIGSSGALTSTTAFIVDQGNNVPYGFGGESSGTQSVAEVLKMITGTGNLSLTGVEIPSNVSSTEYKTATGIHTSFSGVANALGITDKTELGILIYGDDYLGDSNSSSSSSSGGGGGNGQIDIQGTSQYTVSFESNSGTAVTSQTVNNGSGVTQPANPTRSGYAFAGWYKDAGLTTAWNFATDTVIGDATLYAKRKQDGVCGSANGSNVASAPTINLCSNGTASVVVGTLGPWSWSCTGSNGGTTATCDASRTTGPYTTCKVLSVVTNAQISSYKGQEYTMCSSLGTGYEWADRSRAIHYGGGGSTIPTYPGDPHLGAVPWIALNANYSVTPITPYISKSYAGYTGARVIYRAWLRRYNDDATYEIYNAYYSSNQARTGPEPGLETTQSSPSNPSVFSATAPQTFVNPNDAGSAGAILCCK